MSDLSQYLGKVTVTDGAWGTLLQQSGLTPGMCPDAMNVENAPAVLAVAESYVRAGAGVILTNTFRSNRFVLEHWKLGDRAAELAQNGAALSRKAAGDRAAVFASIGPTGKIVMMDEVPRERIYEAFAEQAAGCARGGADAIVCETFSELDELLLAVSAARERTHLPVVACMTFDSGPDRCSTMMGTTPEDLARAAVEAGAAAVGANCGGGPEHFVPVARRLRKTTALPIWLKPNAGLPLVRDGQTVFPMGPEAFARFVPEMIAAGANFIGGCCGTTPEHIRAVRAAIDAGRR